VCGSVWCRSNNSEAQFVAPPEVKWEYDTTSLWCAATRGDGVLTIRVEAERIWYRLQVFGDNGRVVWVKVIPWIKYVSIVAFHPDFAR
jgi:hypothetical protein